MPFPERFAPETMDIYSEGLIKRLWVVSMPIAETADLDAWVAVHFPRRARGETARDAEARRHRRPRPGSRSPSVIDRAANETSAAVSTLSSSAGHAPTSSRDVRRRRSARPSSIARCSMRSWPRSTSTRKPRPRSRQWRHMCRERPTPRRCMATRSMRHGRWTSCPGQTAWTPGESWSKRGVADRFDRRGGFSIVSTTLPRGVTLDDWIAANVPAPTQAGNRVGSGSRSSAIPTGAVAGG